MVAPRIVVEDRPLDLNNVVRALIGGLCAAMLVALSDLKPVAADELAERKAIDRALQPHYHQRDFHALEAMAEELRTTRARTGSGVWKLSVFYATLQWLNSEDFVGDYPKGPNWQRLDAWIAATPTAPTPYILKAFALKSLAIWTTQHATVTQGTLSGWQPDVAFLAEAQRVLDEAKPFAARDPHYYTVLIDLLRTMGADTQDVLIAHAEAMAREPLYYQTHFVAFEHLLHATGRNDKMAATFANTVYRATMEAEGEAVYARLFWMAYERVYGVANFGEAPIDWDRMRSGLGQIVKKHGTAWNAQHAALFACLRGDRQVTRDMFDASREPPVKELWPHPLVHKACTTFAGR